MDESSPFGTCGAFGLKQDRISRRTRKKKKKTLPRESLPSNMLLRRSGKYE